MSISHPKYKCNHEENRKKICALCGKKIIFQSKPDHHFLLSEKHTDLIKKHINDQFDISNEKFPKSVCSTCRLTLNEYEKGIFKRPLPTMPNYEDLNLAKETRTMICNCYICLTARLTSHSKKIKGRGHVRQLSTKIDINNGLDGTEQNASLSKTEAKATKPRTSIEICSSCFQEIGKGIAHSCKGSSSSTARDNVFNILVDKLPEKQQNQIVTSILKRKISKSDKETGSELILNTLGSKARISVNKKKKRK